MNISLNNNTNFSFLTSSVAASRFKPIVYVVSALAIGILIYKCYLQFSKTPFNFMDLLKDKKITKNPEVLNEDSSVVAVEKVKVTFDQLLKNRLEFAKKVYFPTKNNLISNFAKTEELQNEVVEHANQTRPMLHERVWAMIPRMIEHKKTHGSEKEKQIYGNITPTQFLDRLIQKRPLAFITGFDNYMLSGGEEGWGGFEEIGTSLEAESLKLENYQSYFEMSLSALMSMFVPTHFINDGDRNNKAKKGSEGTFEPKGIFAGMVGARFEKPGMMEWAHMVITPEQNTAENGYGASANPHNPKTQELKLWAELYKSRVGDQFAFPDYDQVTKDESGRYKKIHHSDYEDLYLDTHVYSERMKLVVEPYLLESNERAKEQGKQAYLHIVGLGLGVWELDACQTSLLVSVYVNLLHKLKSKLDHISDINFSWFDKLSTNDREKAIAFLKEKGNPINVQFSKRNPAAKLTGEDEGKLLIAQYAWDSNSFPGNEYWMGNLSDSGDPAAACCSMIPELQNPQINPNVCADHLVLRGKK